MLSVVQERKCPHLTVQSRRALWGPLRFMTRPAVAPRNVTGAHLSWLVEINLRFLTPTDDRNDQTLHALGTPVIDTEAAHK